MKIIETIKSWSVQKKVFSGLASATIVAGIVYGVIKVNDYIQTKKSTKK